MCLGIDLLSGLYYYDLGLLKRENGYYCLVDLKTGEWYEKMTIYYIQTLLKQWNQRREIVASFVEKCQ